MGTCDSTTTKAITEKLIHHYFGVPFLCLGWQRSAGPTESWDPTPSWPSCTVRLLFALIRAWPRCHDPPLPLPRSISARNTPRKSRHTWQPLLFTSVRIFQLFCVCGLRLTMHIGQWVRSIFPVAYANFEHLPPISEEVPSMASSCVVPRPLLRRLS